MQGTRTVAEIQVIHGLAEADHHRAWLQCGRISLRETGHHHLVKRVDASDEDFQHIVAIGVGRRPGSNESRTRSWSWSMNTVQFGMPGSVVSRVPLPLSSRHTVPLI